MENNLQQEIEWLNENLNAVVRNQAEIYAELKEIEGKMKQEPKA